MLFYSFTYCLFIAIVFLIYWFLLNRNLKLQNFFILSASLFFYGWWDFRFLGLILLSIVVDYFVALKIQQAVRQKQKKAFLVLSVTSNLLLLGFFKYFNFFIDSLQLVLGNIGLATSESSLQIILPVGISFYTFQTMSYTIDVYRGKMRATEDFVVFAAYVSFFPQLVAGPIERAKKLLPQFLTHRTFDPYQATDGLRQILWGLFKKLVIADNCAVFVSQVFDQGLELNSLAHWVGMIFFAFQIYGDFSGYSDIALGSARLLGFNLSQNFAYPFFSRNYAEFWRRWHISLSTWFRDYFYVAIGGGKRKVLNLMLLFTLSGLWHGASWNFVIWGLLNGLMFIPSIVNRTTNRYTGVAANDSTLPTFKEFFNIIRTFASLCITYVFFRAADLNAVLIYYKKLFSFSSNGASLNYVSTAVTLSLIFIFVIIEWLGRKDQYAIEKIGHNMPLVLRWLTYLVIFISLSSIAGRPQEFVYFQF